MTKQLIKLVELKAWTSLARVRPFIYDDARQCARASSHLLSSGLGRSVVICGRSSLMYDESKFNKLWTSVKTCSESDIYTMTLRQIIQFYS